MISYHSLEYLYTKENGRKVYVKQMISVKSESGTGKQLCSFSLLVSVNVFNKT